MYNQANMRLHVDLFIQYNFWPKNSKLTMLSTHILKSTILSYSSTHQIALNKRCPQSSQYRNWPAYYQVMVNFTLTLLITGKENC